MKKVIILLLALTTVNVAVLAQSKFGHINSQEILQIMPERAAAEQQLNDFRAQLDQTMKTLSETYQTKMAGFQSLDPNTTPSSTVEDMRNEILGLEKRIQEFQVSAENDLIKKNEELLQPMLTKLQDAITAVGEESGFTYIFDLSTGAIVFEAGEDIGPLVKEKLGI